ncbi:MAG: CGGC domain-containing protein [Euryarchaeota archaeon]|nr:CGGC domain-containing protein [Euryarchaeota archaeon]MBU4139313.1 CGGC domain-containing protein [Euryarchaeota archaeon]
MEWEPEALQELEKVPSHVRIMAKMAIEMSLGKKGNTIVTLADVREAEAQFRALMKKDEKTTRIAVVRCDIVSEVCPGVACFNAFNKRKVHFSDYRKDTEIIGFFTCGGCPGRRIFRLVDNLLKHNVDVIHLSSCMLMEKSYSKCPHLEDIKKMITRKGVKVVEGTHH